MYSKSKSLSDALQEYIPLLAIEPVIEWFNKHYVILRITKNRLTKLGDFRPGISGKPSYISVNHNLNRYGFLITLLHEMAHAVVHETYSRGNLPHGKAWKDTYRKLAMPYIEKGIFPDKISEAYTQYLINPLASGSAFIPLVEALREYDDSKDEMNVSMIVPDAYFSIPSGRVFQMVGKLRKRYRCYCIDNKKTYLFSPMAIIKPLLLPIAEHCEN